MKRREQHRSKLLWVGVWLGTVIFSLVLSSLSGLIATADTTQASQQTWLTTAPVLKTIQDTVPAAELPYRTGGNRDCQQRTSTTRPKQLVIQWPFVQAAQTKPACAVDATYGSIDEQGYMQRASTGVTGIVKDQTGAQAIVVAVPRSSSMLVLDKSAPGQTVYLYVYRDVKESLKTTISLDGSVIHRLTRPPTVSLRDAQNKLLGVQFDSAAFSANGQWLTVDIPGMGLSKIDLLTMNITPFVRWPIGYDSGSDPYYQTAISGKGRYVVVGSTGYQLLKLFDTQTCTKPLLAMYDSCQSLDLQSYMTRHIPGFVGVSRVQFVDEAAVDFYAARKVSGRTVYGHYLLHLPQHTSNVGYLGLGDSFSSGEGAYSYKNGTDTRQNKCHLSLRSYPFVLGQELGLSTYHSVACSGAVIDDFIYPEQGAYNSKLSQASGKADDSSDAEIYAEYLPGYRVQKNFVDRDKPAVITLTAGGNDIGFSDIIKRCVGLDTCYPYREEREQLLNLIDDQFDRLADLYQQVRQASGSAETRIYVLGYPEVAQPEGSCAANVHLNKGELYFANEFIDYLNSVIQQAAAKAGVLYVDVGHALDGHRFCETDSWNVAINGLTKGNDAPASLGGPIGNESFHPNQLGQWLLAAAVQQQTNDLTAAMPTADAKLQLNIQHDQLSLIQNVPTLGSTEATTPKLEVYREGPAVMAQGQPTTLTVAGDSYALQADSTVNISLHSDPVHLADAQIDDTGNFTTTVTGPRTVPTGYHTLHIRGRNLAGEAVDLFKTVLVTDGENVPANSCIAVANANIDQDGDGIDDACDGVIGTSATVQAAFTNVQRMTRKLEPEGAPRIDSASDSSLAPQQHNTVDTSLPHKTRHVLGNQFLGKALDSITPLARGVTAWVWVVLAGVAAGLGIWCVRHKSRDGRVY